VEVAVGPLVGHLADYLDAIEFVAVDGRREEHCGTGFLAVDDGDRDANRVPR